MAILHPGPLDTDHPVHPAPLHHLLALQREAQLDKERHGTIEILEDDADIVHPLNRHGSNLR
jgi:hypothetical protein